MTQSELHVPVQPKLSLRPHLQQTHLRTVIPARLKEQAYSTVF